MRLKPFEVTSIALAGQDQTVELFDRLHRFLEIAGFPVTFFIVLGIGGCGRQTWYDFLPLSSMIRGVV
ncbi:hypothetical protein DFR67_1221, partial [Williamsia limnetica]